MYQIRKTQISERSTLVDIIAPGGLAFVYIDFKIAGEWTRSPADTYKI